MKKLHVYRIKMEAAQKTSKLIKGVSKSQAMQHLIGQLGISVELAGQEDLIASIGKGEKIETAGVES